MPKLVLKFENEILKEKFVGQAPVRIGRAPASDLAIDNPAVSHEHARIFTENGRLVLEDLGSLNGTFVNGQRVKSISLRSGDTVSIGKHKIVVLESREPENASNWEPQSKRATPKLHETMILGTRERNEFFQRAAEQGESAQVAPSRMKVPTLLVQKGRTNQREYTLTDKLMVIGKSAMATVRLFGWFAPKAAAQISRRSDDSFYLGGAERTPKVNGHRVEHPTKLQNGDIIEVAGIRLQFAFRD